MRKAQTALFASVLLALSLLLAACGSPVTTPNAYSRGEVTEPLTLWASEDTPLAAAISELAARYQEQEPLRPVTVKLFPTEGQMLDALSEEKPDLLLCSDRGLLCLREESALRSLAFSAESAPRFFPAFEEAAAETGTGFYPLGANVPVLVLSEKNRTLLRNSESVEELCSAASAYAASRDKAFFGMASYSRFFAEAMAQRGFSFHAQKELDRKSEVYREIYNLLAGAAFDGGLRPETAAVLESVRSGELVCAVCELRDLEEAERRELMVLPVPPMAGCEPLNYAEYWGIAAVGNGENTEAAARFVSWLCTYDHASALVLESGLLPSGDGNWARSAGAYSEGLREVAGQVRFMTWSEDSEWVLYGEDFDRSFGEALALLS